MAKQLFISIVILVCCGAFDQSRHNYEHTASLQFVTQVSPYLTVFWEPCYPKKEKNKAAYKLILE